ncbi:S9 family peptidase [Solitalea canadensis]|uniref:Dipeptidyl aminopeptidase/acylaminoacyl peptidase n=1 Tax=Solitalea canadensis (strain ATCC 29591 / DSM 3403 / JCM 21819 / LMG 8368 / NBRC 15130 / NCIMB 12057 / USAM 9D) TaxID=929556 RepID=H8KX22_SOLCM|nr:S9 family peptidase [Solitalea canadensis]AFD08351.1 dipeptidyl aminopeptidase/acylaminoacyl peptidase [Solitalea canadensis DSM 3403]
MKVFCKYVLFLFAVVISACDKKTAVREIPIADFFRNPERTYFRLSPDGEYVAFLQPYNNRLNIFVQKLSSNEVTQVTAESEDAVLKYWWGGNNQLVYLKDNNGDEKYHLYAVNKDGSNSHDITPYPEVTVRLIDILDDGNILMLMNKRDPKKFDAYRMNLETGESKIIAENPGNINFWQADHEGKLLLAIETDGVNERLLYRPSEDKPFKVVTSIGFNETLDPQCFSFQNNKHIYALSNIGRDKMALVEIDLQTGKEIKTIYENKDVDVAEIGYSKVLKRLLWVGFTTWKYEVHFLDEPSQCFYENISKKLPGKDLWIAGVDKKEEKFLVRTYSDKNPGTFYLYENNSDKLTKLSDVSPWIHESEMADMKPIAYQSRDGLTINGYLTLPKGKESEKLPLVVIPHGGPSPWSRTKWGYNSEVQFLANRGYAVLQVNYRGSTGYGKAFFQASFKEWGGKMQDDITDGVKWLIKKNVADSNRIAIYGNGYGGYSAFIGCIKTPELYRCGVSYCGLLNLFTYLKDIPPYYKSMQGMYYALVGNPESDADALRDVSPIFHAEKINTPMLIAQGAKDPRVNVEETNQLVKTLQKRGVDVKYILKQNEGAYFTKQENRLAFYNAMEEFFNENLKK